MKTFDDSNLDVLQNIEYGIIMVYRADPKVLDMDVKDAIDSLVRHYQAEEEQLRPPAPRLGDLAQRVFGSVQEVCEWRLGRSPRADDTPEDLPIPISELVECLRKIQKSIRRWSSEGGKRGYLDFIGEYLR